MRSSIINSIVLIALFVVMVISLSFSGNGFSKVKCADITVLINEDSPRFLDEDEIKAIIKKGDEDLFEKNLDAINTNQLEVKLEKVASIRNAEVFRRIDGERLDFKGRLIVEIDQRNPIVRIINGKQDYYLDRAGVKIPSNDKFTAKVLLVNGTITDAYAKKKLLPLVRFVAADPFWNAMLDQIYVSKTEELIVVTKIGDQRIDFGKTDRYKEKLRNLKAVFKQEFAECGWQKYKSINLKYKNQVVCTKK